MTNIGGDDFGAALDSRMPERKRGRPRGDSAPKRAGTVSKINLAQFQKSVIAGLQTINSLAIQYINGYAMYSLAADEYEPLAKVIASEVDASPRLQRWVTSAGSMGTHGATIFVLAQLLMRRYPLYMQQKAQNAGTTGSPDNNAAVSMEPGRAYGGDRGYGYGQDVPHIPITANADLQPEPQEQSGLYAATG